MRFNVYLDEETGKRLAAATKASHKSPNALIREAIALWLAQHECKTRPPEVMEFEGEPDFPAFEGSRSDLRETKDDPFV